MQDLNVRTHALPTSVDRFGRALFASSLWLQVGFVGASVLAAGVLQLIDGNTKTISAFTLAATGAVMAAISWSRARTVLESGGPRPAPTVFVRPRARAGAILAQ